MTPGAMADTELDAGKSAPREEASLDFSFVVSGVWPLLLAGFIFRIIIGAIHGTAFTIDTGTFEAWSIRLADRGPWDFYAKDYFSDYAPGYLYVLFLVGKLNTLFEFGTHEFQFIFKLPSIFADLGIAYILWRFLDRERSAVRLGAVAAYLLFPPALLIGAVWGQVDSLSVFFLMLSIFWISRDKPVEGAAAYVVGFVIKPQIIAALPFLAFWILRRYPPDLSKPLSEIISAMWLKTAAAGFAVLLLLIIPFFPDYPWDFITHLKNSADVENYRVGSFWAYNFWGMWGFFKPDNTEYMGLTYQVWGLSLFAISMLAILYSLRDAEGDRALALGTALCLLAFYIFLTRMHERYMFPFFVPFLAACVLYRSPLLWTVFAVLAVTQFLNLYQVYGYYQPNELKIHDIYQYFDKAEVLGTGWPLARVLSLVTFVAFTAVLAWTFLVAARWRRSEAA